MITVSLEEAFAFVLLVESFSLLSSQLSVAGSIVSIPSRLDTFAQVEK